MAELFKDTKVKASSIKSYISYFKNFFHLEIVNEDTVKNVLEVPVEGVMEAVNNLSTPSSKKRILNTIIVFGKLIQLDDVLLSVYRGSRDTEAGTVKSVLNKNMLSVAQANNWIEWADVIKVRNTLQKIYKVSPQTVEQEYLFLCFITHLPPRRNIDYTKIHISQDMPETNRLLLTTKYSKKPSYIIYNEYKTNTTYGEQKIEIPNPLKTLLLNILPTKKDYLFTDKRGNELTTDCFTRFINGIFKQYFDTKKKIGIDILRHSFLTDFNKTLPTLEQREKVAYQMGHSVVTQLEYVKSIVLTATETETPAVETETPEIVEIENV